MPIKIGDKQTVVRLGTGDVLMAAARWPAEETGRLVVFHECAPRQIGQEANPFDRDDLAMMARASTETAPVVLEFSRPESIDALIGLLQGLLQGLRKNLKPE